MQTELNQMERRQVEVTIKKSYSKAVLRNLETSKIKIIFKYSYRSLSKEGEVEGDWTWLPLT